MRTVSYYYICKCALLDPVLGLMSTIHTISSISLRPIFVLPSPLCAYLTKCRCVDSFIFNLHSVQVWILNFDSKIWSPTKYSVHPCSIIEEVPCPFEYVQCKSVPISCQCKSVPISCQCKSVPISCQCKSVPISCQCKSMPISCQCKSVPISCQSSVQVTTWEQFDRFLTKFVVGKSNKVW